MYEGGFLRDLGWRLVGEGVKDRWFSWGSEFIRVDEDEERGERESSKFLSIRLTTSRHSYSVKILKRAYFSTYEGSFKVFGKIFRRV